MEQYGRGGGGMNPGHPMPLEWGIIQCAFQEHKVLGKARAAVSSTENPFADNDMATFRLYETEMSGLFFVRPCRLDEYVWEMDLEE
ncbi:MAG: hypothetical protein NC388_08540 [Clostridium sp.]|nr:hypothetical protein [Clostridium sp.]